jgi:hypothetical protein
MMTLIGGMSYVTPMRSMVALTKTEEYVVNISQCSRINVIYKDLKWNNGICIAISPFAWL